MISIVAILTFAGALGAVGFVLYATIAPSLAKIEAALSGRGVTSSLPPLPPRRASTLRVTVSPVAQPVYWRAAA
jgi:hypothetical protein